MVDLLELREIEGLATYSEASISQSEGKQWLNVSQSSSGGDSFDEEDLCSSESEMATEFSSRPQTAESHGQLESLSQLSLDSRAESVISISKPTTSHTSKQELIRQIHLRRHIDQLQRTLEQREAQVAEIRMKLSLCREQVNALLVKEASLNDSIMELDGSKAPSLGLLRSQLNKVRIELDTERKVELNIQNELTEAELELSEARKSAEQFQQANTLLIQREQNTMAVKKKQAARRLQAENQLVLQAQQTRRLNEKQLSATAREYEQQTRSLLEQAKLSQEKGKQFLQQTIEKRRQEEAVLEEQQRAHLDKRIKAIISLKNNIESTQSTMQAQNMLQAEANRKKNALEERQREKISLEGGNPDEAILRKQRIESFEMSKEAFLKKQNRRQVEIVNKLLEEEKVLKRAEEKLSKSHWHGRQECPHPTKKSSHKTRNLKRLGSVTNKAGLSKFPLLTDQIDNAPVATEPAEDEPGIVTVADKESVVNGESVVQPDIPGLWDHSGKQPPIKKEKSKSEIEKMNLAMEKLKASRVSKQVVAGKEFKGQAFTAKPSVVVFKDFDIGKLYRKKITLTNVSYSFNYCQLIGVTDNLKDFITIDFNPPGSLSAGLTCQMTITFQPKVDEDILGSIEMLSQTGPFSIPLHCLNKKCLVAAEKTLVDFGRVCIGETVRKSLTLTNSGAIATAFSFSSATPSLQAVSESVVIVEDPPGDPASDPSAFSIMSNLETGPSRLDNFTVGGVEEKMSRSVGNLSSVSDQSLSWPNKDKADSNKDSEEQPAEDLDIIKDDVGPSIVVGAVKEGVIPGFSSVTLELLYSPLRALEHSHRFSISFSQPTMPPIVIAAQGCGAELPVWVERESIDLQTCMLGRLYQDTVVLHNGTSVAMRVSFQVPCVLQAHLEVLPKHGVVQANSCLSAQLKFTPKSSLLGSSCEQYFNDRNLVMPIEVRVVDQVQPVPFTVLALVTPLELILDSQSIDFGQCTTHESVVSVLRVTNSSILPQSFGFVELPACVDVQPGDGFGVILPQETLDFDVIFSPRKPQDYNFELTLKTEYDKTYKICCSGQGVLPALKLSHNAISFSATALNDTSTATISISNPRLGRLDSAVIRGAILPQADKMFEFIVPQDVPIRICPQVGTVPMGGSMSVRVELRPCINEEAIQEEALRLAREEMARQAEENTRLEQEKLEQEQANKKKPGKKATGLAQKSDLLSNSKNSLSSSNSKQLSESNSTVQEPQPPEPGSDMWCKAEHNLLLGYTQSCLQSSIPCFVSSGTALQYRVEDTLYLEVSAAVLRPGLVVESQGGSTTVDYGSVGTGDSSTKTITLNNISDKQLQLRGSALDPGGVFELRNSLRSLQPGQTTDLILRFTPTTGGKFWEDYSLRYNDCSTLRLKLIGTGVEPVVSLSPDTRELDFGHVMAGDTTSASIELSNSSALAVRYMAVLESSLPHAASNRRKQGLPFRASNYNGQPAFSCPDSEGSINSNDSVELKLLFKPDHQNSLYADTLHIHINGNLMFSVELKANAWTNNMYLAGVDYDEQPLVLVLTHHLSSVDCLSSASGEGKGKNHQSAVVTKDLVVGTIKSSLVKKASGEMSIESLPSSNPHSKFFSINPAKLSIEAGSSKTVSISFSPPADPTLTSLAVNTNITLKGDTTQVFRLLLRGLVCE